MSESDKSPFNYFDTEHALKEHAFIISASGGVAGVKDVGLVDSVIGLVQNDEYYPEFLDKVTHLVFGLNKNHAFNDGNKRASIALSSFFLELNNHDFAIAQYTRGMEDVAIWVAKSFINKEVLKKIIEFLLYDNPINIEYFIDQAKLYRPFIEPQDAPIRGDLLVEMVEDWIGEKDLGEDTKIKLLNAVSEKSKA